MADPKKGRYLPDFEVHVIKQDVKVRQTSYALSAKPAEGEKRQPGRFVHKDVIVKESWLVCFPRRHSILITDPEEMIRLGFAQYENEDERTGFVLKSPAVTDHTTGLKLDMDDSMASIADQIRATTSLKSLGRIPVTIGEAKSN